MSDTKQRKPRAKRAQPIKGWRAIAAATGRAINQSVSERTARRWADQSRGLRLPVSKYPNGATYMRASHLRLFAIAWREGLPTGGKVTKSAS